jgi:D-aspartate ligase
MPSPKDHAAILLTLSPTGLAVARALGAHGVAVYGIDSNRSEIGHFSRWVKRPRGIACLPAGDELIEGICALAETLKNPPVLYVAGDPYIDLVAQHHKRLREHCILPESICPEIASLFLNKERFYRRCEELGVAMPTTFFPRDEGEAADAGRALRYPAIVKPTHGHRFRKKLGGKKLIEVEGAEDLVAWWVRFRDWGGDAVLQEIIPGPESNIFVAAVYSDKTREARSIFTAHKVRQYPPLYGSGSYMESRWSEEIAQLSREIVQALDYAGICGTEFKWDARDELWKLIEINPRPTLWFDLVRASGVELIWDAHCDLIGAPNPPRSDTQKDGVRWQLLARDLASAMHFIARGDLSVLELFSRVLNPARKNYAATALSDPGTFIGAPINIVAKLFAHSGEE